MSLLKSIEDKGAVVEWSPIQQHANLVAVGTKDSTGSGFDDYGGELELHRLDLEDTSSSSTTMIGYTRATSRFASIAWSKMCTNNDTYPYGLIAGGMVDGNINIWDPYKMQQQDPDPLLSTILQHKGAVSGLQFNPHNESSHLLASGGADGEVYVLSLDKPDQPTVFIPAPPPSNTKHTSDITKVAWNTQVAHILASASTNGSTIVWDLRQKKAWCELRDPTGGTVSDIAWNPDQGLHLITACGDDKNPVLKLWDLRSSTSLPLATLTGHTEGILSVSWCPYDPSLLLSCAKDNKTLMWDLFHLQSVYELPANTVRRSSTTEPGAFGSLASTAGQKRYHVGWSPCLPAVTTACSFDRRIEFYSLSGARSTLGRAPKWLRRPTSASFGFGGKLSTTGLGEAAPTQANSNTQGVEPAKPVKLWQVVDDSDFVTASDAFHDSLAGGDFRAIAAARGTDMNLSEHDQAVWSMMKIICFEKNAREELLAYLGFDGTSIANVAEEYMKSKSSDKNASIAITNADMPPPAISPSSANGAADDVFAAPPVAPVESAVTEISTTDTNSVQNISEEVEKLSMSLSSEAKSRVDTEIQLLSLSALRAEEAEPLIRRALVVGNFSAAVDCCIEAGLLTEALLLAQWGESALLERAQQAFFARSKRPFLKILHTIIKSELMEYVVSSNLETWKETLALLGTYGKPEEFPALCEALGSRLETEAKDYKSASLCFMCAVNVPKTIGFWVSQLEDSNAKLGYTDTVALQRFVEKVVVFTEANPVSDLGADCVKFFSEYADMLSSQGRLNVAARYLRDDGPVTAVLRDRLYHAGTKPAGSRPPAFPFEKIVVGSGVSPQSTTKQPNNQTQPHAMNSTAPRPGQMSTQPRSQPMQSAQSTHSTFSQPAMNNVSSSQASPYGGTQQQHINTTQPQFMQQPQVHQPQQQSQAVQGGQNLPINPLQLVLPDGWIELYDANTNKWYYANQGMGLTQWEPPAGAVSKQMTSPVPQPAQQVSPMPTQPQYGSQPTMPMMQPQQQQLQPKQESSPALMQMPATSGIGAGAANTGRIGEVPPQIDSLEAIVQQVSVNSAPHERRQVTALQQAVGVLQQKCSQGMVEGDVLDKLGQFVACLERRDAQAANTIYTQLSTTAWANHKDWVKNLKMVTTLIRR